MTLWPILPEATFGLAIWLRLVSRRFSAAGTIPAGSCAPGTKVQDPALHTRNQRTQAGRRHERRDEARARQTLDLPHLCGPLDRGRFQRALPRQPRQGADGPLGRLRPADADGLRPGPRAGEGRGRQGRRVHRASRRHAGPLRGHPARHHEHVDDDQRDGALAAGALRRRRGRAGRAARRPPGHDAERHHQGVSLARHLRVPARALHAADPRRDPVHHVRDAEMESR